MSGLRRALTSLLLLTCACQAIQLPLPATPAPTPSRPTPAAVADAPLPATRGEAGVADEGLLTALYERVAPAVVAISVYAAPGDTMGQKRGSGFLMDAMGHIVTNAHVIRDAARLEVVFHDGRIAPAALRGADGASDLALLQVDAAAVAGLSSLVLADSDALRPGQRVVVIGNPFGLNNSMTQGIISATGRQLPPALLTDAGLPQGFSNPAVLQLDARISSGNSGGPVVNTRGEVIGVATAIRSAGGGFQGVGFAVPANTLRRVAPELIERGSVRYAWLGISTQREEDGFSVAALVEALGLTTNKGVLIDRVHRDSPAQLAGLRGGSERIMLRGVEVCAGGDIIVAINGHFVNNLDELLAWLVSYGHPGDEVTLLVVRGEETLELSLSLGARPRPGDDLAPADCADGP
ncbi:MAG: trypsin-like peptidase domain-containing protein [Anaerolineaceae bacterium]|nr:trypsin-like peptidase domain-containing protein [Anaerolineaceae bacterium]